jgi:hypothetical protein
MTADRTSIRLIPEHWRTACWPRPGGMPSVFTAFVRSLQGESTPDADLFHDAWKRLESVLASEMRKRGLWQSPPCYLGVFGAERWDAEERGGDPMARAWGAASGQVGALGELVADCYAFIFVDRLRSLKRQLEEKPDIDGLVLLNVRHFLHERQREHDPVGYQVFETVRTVVREAIAQGNLHVLAGDERVRNGTVLGFVPGPEPRPPLADLGGLVARWNDTLLADLLGARGRRQESARDHLRQRLLELTEHGVRAFKFKSLVDPLKDDARRRWVALLASERRHAGGQAASGTPADSALESRQSFEFLVRCVTAAIRRIEADVRTRTYLAALWQFLSRQPAAGEDGHAGPGAVAAEIGDEDLLSHRQLGKRLHIPRERLPMLFTTLRQLAARCWAAGMARLEGLPQQRPRAPRREGPPVRRGSPGH